MTRSIAALLTVAQFFVYALSGTLCPGSLWAQTGADKMLLAAQDQIKSAPTFDAKVEVAGRTAQDLMVRGRSDEARALLKQVGAGHVDARLTILTARTYLTYPPTSAEDAMAVLRPFLKANPKHIEGLLEWARALREGHQYPDAVKTYDILIRLNPKDLRPHDMRAHYGKIDTLMVEKKWKPAEDAARAALAIDDKNPESQYYLGRVFERRDDVKNPKETAVAQFKKAVELSGADTRFVAPLIFAQMMYGAGDFKETLDNLRRRAPGDATVAFGEGMVLDSEGKLPEAVAKFQGALAVDPSLTFAHFALGTLYTGHSLSRVFLGSGRNRSEARASVSNAGQAFTEYATVRLQDPTFPFMFVIDDYQSRMQSFQPQAITPELIEQQKAWQKYWLMLQLRH